MLKKIRSFFYNIIDLLWSFFINGFLTLFPIAATTAIFHFTFKFLKTLLEPISTIRPEFLAWIPHVEIILTVFIIFIFGGILRLFLLKQIINLLEDLLCKIPIIRPIYAGLKQLVNAFNPDNHIAFKKVVLIEFPSKGLHSIGFLTSELVKELRPKKEVCYYNIFIPTTPNPMSGYFVILPKSEVIITNLNRQEAMAMIISVGIIQPNYKKNYFE